MTDTWVPIVTPSSTWLVDAEAPLRIIEAGDQVRVTELGSLRVTEAFTRDPWSPLTTPPDVWT